MSERKELGPNIVLGYYLTHELPDGSVVTLCFNKKGIKVNDMEPPIPWAKVDEYREKIGKPRNDS